MLILINVVRALQFLVFIRVMLTWIMPGNPPRAILPLTSRIDRVLKRFQVLIPAGQGYVDLGPMLFLLLLEVVNRILIGIVLSGG
ncbi:MAG: YggT family protein [Candidatus Riflebacteria bacterium]|nr:YggT family protein [Candidatus Riflebacteria bacterium]